MKIKFTIEDIQEAYCDKASDQGWCEKVKDCEDCMFDKENIEEFKVWAQTNVAPLLGPPRAKQK